MQCIYVYIHDISIRCLAVTPHPRGHPEPGRDRAPRRAEAGPGLGAGGGGAAKGHLAEPSGRQSWVNPWWFHRKSLWDLNDLPELYELTWCLWFVVWSIWCIWLEFVRPCPWFYQICFIHVMFLHVFSVSMKSAEKMVGVSSTALDGWNSNW